MTAYSVSGTLTPDATGSTGEPAGTSDGQNYWTYTGGDAGTWYLYFVTAANRWFISGTLGKSLGFGFSEARWLTGTVPKGTLPADAIAGAYTPGHPSGGTATVAESTPPTGQRQSRIAIHAAVQIQCQQCGAMMAADYAFHAESAKE